MATALSFLTDKLSPDLLAITLPTSLKLIKLTTATDSEARYEGLQGLMAAGVLNVWIYTSGGDRAMGMGEIVIPFLGELVEVMGIYSVRYLQVSLSTPYHRDPPPR